MPLQAANGIANDEVRDMDQPIRDYLAEARMSVVSTANGPDDALAEQFRQQYPTVSEETHVWDESVVERVSAAMGRQEDRADEAPVMLSPEEWAPVFDPAPRRRNRVPSGLVNIWVTIREAHSDNVSVRIGDDLYPMEREDALSFARSDFESWFQERTAHLEWPPEDSFDWAESQVRAREESYRVVKERASA